MSELTTGKFQLNDDTLEELEKRHRKARNEQDRVVRRLIRAVHLCAPESNSLNVLYSFVDEGRDINRHIYNAVPKMASSERASKLHSLLLPVDKNWCSIETRADKNSEYQYSTDGTKAIFNLINASNLHTVANSFFQDLNLGCAALWIDSPSDDDPLVFRNLPGVALMPEFSEDPKCMNLWFKVAISDDDIKPEFTGRKGQDNRNFLTCGYLDISKKGATEKLYLFIQFLNDDFSEAYFYDVKPYRQLVLVNDTKRAGESRGYGIILACLEQIEFLNSITGGLRRYAEYSSDPALMVPDNVPKEISGLRGRILSSSLGHQGQPLVQPLEWAYQTQAIWEIVKDQEGFIREFFNVTPYGNVEETPVRTATEVGARQEQTQRRDVSDISRISYELINGIAYSVIDIITKRALKGHDLLKDSHRVMFESPEIDLQRAENINSLNQLATLETQFFGPGAFPMLNNPIKVHDYLYDNLKVDTSLSMPASALKQALTNAHKQANNPQGPQSDDQQNSTQSGAQQGLQTEQPQQPTPINPTQPGYGGSLSGLGV